MQLEWHFSFHPVIIPARDPLLDIDKPHKDAFEHYYSLPNAL